jgi:phosphatidylglycerol:prolipoprotein diacylglycerol transferase
MFPEIIRIGPIAVYSYGFMMMLAFFVGIMLAVKRGARLGISSTMIWDLSIWILISSLAGARILYVLTHLDEFTNNWLSIVNPIQPDGRFGIAGMTLLGGVIAAVIASHYFMRKHKLPFWQVTDLLAPSLALGFALGRLGCFANGCCYGGPTHSFIGLIFPPGSPAGYQFPNTPILPTQLFEAGWGVLLFLALLFADRHKRFEGFTSALFLIGYAVSRLAIDTVRIIDPGEYLIHGASFSFTISQALGLVMIGLGVWVWVRQRRMSG